MNLSMLIFGELLKTSPLCDLWHKFGVQSPIWQSVAGLACELCNRRVLMSRERFRHLGAVDPFHVKMANVVPFKTSIQDFRKIG